MAGMLALPDWTFERTVITVLRALADTVDSVQGQRDDVSRDGTSNNKPKEIRNTNQNEE